MKTRTRKPLAFDARLHTIAIGRIAGEYVTACESIYNDRNAAATPHFDAAEVSDYLTERASSLGKGHRKVYIPVRRGPAGAMVNLALGDINLKEEEVNSFAIRCVLNDYKKRHAGEIRLFEVINAVEAVFPALPHPPAVMEAAADHAATVAENEAEKDGLREEGKQAVLFDLTERLRIGQARARATGKHIGRPAAEFNREKALALRESGYSIRLIARECDTTKNAIEGFFKRENTTDAPLNEAVPF